jgi:hypothetical protein
LKRIKLALRITSKLRTRAAGNKTRMTQFRNPAAEVDHLPAGA